MARLARLQGCPVDSMVLTEGNASVDTRTVPHLRTDAIETIRITEVLNRTVSHYYVLCRVYPRNVDNMPLCQAHV